MQVQALLVYTLSVYTVHVLVYLIVFISLQICDVIDRVLASPAGPIVKELNPVSWNKESILILFELYFSSCITELYSTKEALHVSLLLIWAESHPLLSMVTLSIIMHSSIAVQCIHIAFHCSLILYSHQYIE